MKKITIMLIWCSLALTFPFLIRAGTLANDFNAWHFQPIDVFQLEYASDPQISPDGQKIVYVRNFMDIMTDRRRSNLWIIKYDGSDQRPLTTGNRNDSSPRWSPDGPRLLYVSSAKGSSQLYLRWMETGQTAKLTNLTESPSSITWSPDGQWIAFSMFVKERPKPFVEMPAKPEGAEWAKPPRVIDKLLYRADGRGYLKDGYRQIFILPAEGGTPRQVTSGPYNHGGPLAWTPHGKFLIFSANRHEDWQYDPLNSEIYEVSVVDGSIKALTDRQGPDTNPVLSPDGRQIAYLGFDDQYEGYQITRLYLMKRDGSEKRLISADFDRDVRRPVWSRDGKGLYFQFDDEGNTKIGYISLSGKIQTLASDVGGTSIGRPYASGSFSVARNGRFAYTHTQPDHPADVAVGRKG
ncbi:MAG: DPP IV N-terminal domain-containing protein, partial [bacterium]